MSVAATVRTAIFGYFCVPLVFIDYFPWCLSMAYYEVCTCPQVAVGLFDVPISWAPYLDGKVDS